MINNIEDVRKLYELKKNKAGENDIEKIDNLKVLLSDDNLFFMIPMDTAIGILTFLGLEEREAVLSYRKLISPSQRNEYVTISNKI